jgi:hypothetical protein
MTENETQHGGVIFSVVIFTTEDEVYARRVLAWLYSTGYRNAAGFVFGENEFSIVIKADVGEEHTPRLRELAIALAHAHTNPPALQTFRQFESLD